jgi:NADPH2:quinone reductase
MKAMVLDAPGPPQALKISDRPIPDVEPGWVRIRVRAFGLNRSELMTRLGLSNGVVTFPRVLGIECAGEVDAAPGSSLARGQKVVAMMGGMGRQFDGGYAEYAVVPASIVIPISTRLPWEIVGALPEMLQTAYGSLTTGLDLQPGQTLLVRGGTTSIGMMATALAHDLGATVLATTRQPQRLSTLHRSGVAHPMLDRGAVAEQVRGFVPEGVDAALDLVGAPTLQDSLRATRIHGTVCSTGIVSHEWVIRDFYPIGYIPNGVRLTGYGGEAHDLPPQVLQRMLDRIAADEFIMPPYRTYEFDEVQRAHADMEQNRGIGKIVVRTPWPA